MKETKREISARHNLKFRLVLESLAIGAVTGVVISAFRIITRHVSSVFIDFYSFGRSSLLHAAAMLLFLLCIGFLVGWMVKTDPLIGGSGIPQVSGQLRGLIRMNWRSILPLKFFGGILSVSAGLKVGREGPSIQMGAAVGQGFSEVFKRPNTERKFLISSGAAAGLASAFNAPLSGLVFALEEVHHNFSSVALVSAMSASLSAAVVSALIMGYEPVLLMGPSVHIPFAVYGYLILMAVLASLSAFLFTGGISVGKKIYARLRIPVVWKVILPILITGSLILLNAEFYGSGEPFILLPAGANLPVSRLVFLYIVSGLLLMVAFCSGLPGGIFFPMLVLGSLFGNIFGQILVQFGLMDESLVLAFTVLSMCAYFSAIVRSPVTGILLILELTGSFDFLLTLGLVSLVSYLTAEFFHLKPVYEMLLGYQLHPERLHASKTQKTEKQRGRREPSSILVEFPVYFNSLCDGRRIREIDWPEDVLIVSIKRGDREILPRGDVKLMGGDYLVFLQDANQLDDMKEKICSLTRNELNT